MVYGLVTLVPPALEPVTLDEVKAHLRVDVADEDAYIASLIAAARALSESLTGRALITQTLQMSLDRWPSCGRAVDLPRAPVQSIVSVEVVDASGSTVAVDAQDYEVDVLGIPARMMPARGSLWPVPGPRMGGIKITFVAGFGDIPGDIPSGLRQMLLLLCAHWFERREAVAGDGLAGLPLGIGALMQPFMPVRL